ncbi:MAG TPA: nitrous oxide reductase accessory protein NosL [Deltaproteobacteria bacterium]|nr:nitrous oxide reductase accessory protein NosL [Deltaproteobacteria bacterium]HQJ08847.1 nitrous oxide reductase accessory protein NosL [Deltaproteobacteria bacterium]
MMKLKKVFILPACLGFLCAAGVVFALDDTAAYKSCKYCGMDRTKFSHSRTLVTYDDGTVVGTCSIHCAAVELALNIDKTPTSIEVGDYNTRKLIDASKAFWVVGGDKPGVMTKRAKWAFESREDADAFVKANGGGISSYDEAIKGSYEDMYADTNMIRERRKMKMMKVKAIMEQQGHKCE